MRWNLNKRSGAELALALLVLIGAEFIAYLSLKGLLETNRQVKHTQEVLDTLEELVVVMDSAESSQRGYLLTGDEAYLKLHHSEMAEVPEVLARLRSFKRENAAWHQGVASLAWLIGLRIESLSQSMELRKQKGLPAAAEAVSSGVGAQRMDTLHRAIAEMQNTERQLLAAQRSKWEAKGRRMTGILIFGLLLVFVVLIVAIVAVNREASRRIEALERAERELRRLNRAQRTISASNDAIVHSHAEAELLRQVCRLLVEEGGYRMAWVGFAEHDEARSVRPVASAGVEDGYLEAIRVTWSEDERGGGPIGAAIRAGTPQVARNIRTDTCFAPWREEALRRGYASSLALPLNANGQRLGALMVYSALPDAFDSEEVHLLAQLAANLAHGIQSLRGRTERQQAEEALRCASAYNRRLLEASLDPLVTIAPDGKVTDVNEATEKATGRTRHELVNTDFCDYFTEPAKARAGYEQVFREGWVQDYALEIRHADGHTTPVLYNATVYRDQDGKVIGVFAAARDITERKKAEAAMCESEADLRKAQAIAHLGSWHLEIASNRLAWSDEVFRIFGLPKGRTLTYEDFLDMVHPEDRETVQLAWAAALQGAPYDVEHRIVVGDVVKWVRETAAVEFDESNKAVRGIGTAHDVTERKQADQEIRKLNEELEKRVRERTAELQAANQELEAFTYSVSHDLRAPLRHIDGFSRLLVEECGSQLSKGARGYLQRIQDGVCQMSRLVDDLLNLARLGRQEVKLQMTGLGSVVEKVIRELKPETAGRVIVWKIETLPFVECDPPLIAQVFSNLLSNALKYTRPRERAVIEVGPLAGAGQPTIFVRDNGVGFSMKYADKLFGVFQRLHRAEDFEGTGVGLATVQRIIHKHGGRVWAQGKLDKGASFYFTLGASGALQGVSGGVKRESEHGSTTPSGNPSSGGQPG